MREINLLVKCAKSKQRKGTYMCRHHHWWRSCNHLKQKLDIAEDTKVTNLPPIPMYGMGGMPGGIPGTIEGRPGKDILTVWDLTGSLRTPLSC